MRSSENKRRNLESMIKVAVQGKDDDARIGCKHIEKVDYPPFTAEKVLKVIVFFLNKGMRLDFSVEENTKISVENFKESIAQIGAKYWQSLTEEEKQQVRGILE